MEEDQEYQALPDELKKTAMSRDQKVAFHQGMNSWDTKFASLVDQKNAELEDKIPVKGKK